MQYKYAREQADYSDFSSGRVFYSLPGYPAFPIRLASEIFQRCMGYRETSYGISSPCTLYDPCCGAAYHLSVLAYLHGEHIREVIASDIDERAVALAERNLGLLRTEGMDRRIEEIRNMIEQYGKASHQDAMQSALVLREKLSSLRHTHPLEIRLFQSSAADGKRILDNILPHSVDIVLTDVPYGRHSQWQNFERSVPSNPLVSMLAALRAVLSPASIVAIIADKGQKASHDGYKRLEQFQIGKRRVMIFKPIRPQSGE